MWRGMRANVGPGLVLQVAALTLVLAYYWHAPTRRWLARVAEFRAETGFWFGIVSTLFLTVVIAQITTRIVEPRLGTWNRAEADEEELAREEGPPIEPEAEAKGLRWALYAVLIVVVVVLALTLPSGAPLRNPENGDIIGDSPLMSSLIVIISAMFLAAGLAFGRAAGTIKGSEDALGMITKSWASLASLLFLFLLIAQFIAYFDFSNIAQVVAIWLGDFNMEPGSAEYLRITGSAPYHPGAAYFGGFADAAAVAGNAAGDLHTHVKTIAGQVRRRRLDHCFVGGMLAHRVRSVGADIGAIASDHFPLRIDIDLDTAAASPPAGGG